MNRERVTPRTALLLVSYLNRAGRLYAVEGQAEVWADALDDVDFIDAQEAVRAICKRDESGTVTPGMVRGEVKRIRGRRMADRVPPAPPVPLGLAGELHFAAVYRRALGDGDDDDTAMGRACSAVGIAPPDRTLSPGRRLRLEDVGQRVPEDERPDVRAVVQDRRAPRSGRR